MIPEIQGIWELNTITKLVNVQLQIAYKTMTLNQWVLEVKTKN